MIDVVIVGSGNPVCDGCAKDRDPELWELFWRFAQTHGLRRLGFPDST